MVTGPFCLIGQVPLNVEIKAGVTREGQTESQKDSSPSTPLFLFIPAASQRKGLSGSMWSKKNR